ncbi:MAG TPA: CoA pyrophosphatase [Trebonia sp.]|nr:CoA pyrophosphatase [Trebonia sp.]
MASDWRTSGVSAETGHEIAPLSRDTVAARVAGFARVAVDRPELKQAAVAVCVTEVADTPSLLLTRRAARLRSHPGQWALPGGRRDAGESAVQGALRELAEEVGLRLGSEAVLGVLDDYVTRSGYVMTRSSAGPGQPARRPAPAPRSPRCTTSRWPTSTSSRGSSPSLSPTTR